jgi:hypothetical protein
MDVRDVLLKNNVAVKRDSFVTTTVKLIVSGPDNAGIEEGSSENPFKEVVFEFVDRLRKLKLLGKEDVENGK